MNTVGYLLIFVAAILLRAVQRGRASNIPEDTQDTVVALLTGDVAKLKEVAARRGSDNDAETATGPTSEGIASDPGGAVSGENGARLLVEARKLGSAAKGYVWGLTGPTYYDCSGLVWRAAKNIGVYTGPRFTTSSFEKISSTWCVRTNNPASGDIVLWPKKHIGICTGGGSCYSARSPKNGIGNAGIDGITEYVGVQPVYFKVK